MDAEIWINSKRGFPFNISMTWIVAFSLCVPLTISFFTFQKHADIMKLNLNTVAISLFAFFVTDKLISQFKGTLEKKGLGGKDLNKAGNRDDKPTV
jgi:hypothetical protein